jgi:hypothetical protein
MGLALQDHDSAGEKTFVSRLIPKNEAGGYRIALVQVSFY